MTNIIVNKIEKNKEHKKNKKLQISRTKNKNSFQDGVLNLPKNFLTNKRNYHQ
jgi:hypothetical protein